jgi:hypothetical protein
MPMTSEQLSEQRGAIQRNDQAYYDSWLVKIGERARAPVLGEDRTTYRQEQLRAIKRQHLRNHDLYKVNMRGLTGQALDNIEPMVLQAAVDEYWNPRNVPLGEIHERKRMDENGQVRCIEFLGQESFVKFMGRPGRRVTGFRTDQGVIKTQW